MATSSAVAPFTAKSPAEIRDDILRQLRAGLIAQGVTAPNVSPGSEFYIQAQALANELAVVHANIQSRADDLMPDTAGAAGLDRYAAMLGLSRRVAAGAVGYLVLDATSATAIVEGTQLVDGAGLRYAVGATAIYADDAYVPIEAVDTGTETNLATDAVLRWATAPAYASQTALVAAPGLQNGTADEDDETLRQRVLDRLAVPPSTGNYAHVAGYAEQSDGRVQKAFVYPAYRGPSTLAVAVTAAPTTTNKSRQVGATVVSANVAPYVAGVMPEHVQVDVTTVTDTATDVAIGMSLPAAPNASPPGPGGGWVDGSPWPVVDASATYYAPVTVVTTTSSITLTAVAARAPTANVTRVSYLSYAGSAAWTLYTATVLTVTESPAGTYAITLDAPFPAIAVGDYVFPACSNGQAYVDAVLASFAAMGPAEKRATVYSREYRRPQPSLAWPASLASTQLRDLSSVGDEVLDVQWLYRSNADTTTSGSSGKVTPQPPATITDAPKILIPRRVGFYQLP